MKRGPNHKAALEMLDCIDRAQSGSLPLEELEEKLWRLLDSTTTEFPPGLSGRVEDLVLKLRRQQEENLAFGGRDADENRGTEGLYQEVTTALSRFLD
jgi:hypothetical protein